MHTFLGALTVGDVFTVSGSAGGLLDGSYTFSSWSPDSGLAGHGILTFSSPTLTGGLNSDASLLTLSYTAPPAPPSTPEVVQTAPTITWAAPSDITDGTALSGTQLNATANVDGTFAYTPAAGVVLHAGSGQTLSVTFTPTDSTDYSSVTQTVSINVTPAPLTVADTTADITDVMVATPAPAVSSGGGGGVVGGGPESVGYVNTTSTVAVTEEATSTAPNQGQVLGASAYNFTTNLTVGSMGADVAALQNLLIADGYLSAAPTGYFGALTKAAVIKFQAAHNTFQSGYVGSLTRGALNMGTTPSSLTSVQLRSVLLLLQSFDTDEATISNVEAALSK